jgi:hypothetical protein
MIIAQLDSNSVGWPCTIPPAYHWAQQDWLLSEIHAGTKLPEHCSSISSNT